MSKIPDSDVLDTLRRRLKARAGIALSLARAYRFMIELEPLVGDGPDPFVQIATVFREWRQAHRDGDIDRAFDAMERSFSLIEACRHRVIARDAAIEAFRVRWAAENAPLSDQTIDGLARFYRLLPFSTSSQSKYEYVLTRRLAGPMGPERRLAPHEDLVEAVMALESAWGAVPVEMEERDARTTVLALKSFAHEADGQADAASFTASALLRRFSAFKMKLGGLLFDRRVSVAVVETNVAVLNVFNQLLTDAGGQPLRGSATAKLSKRLIRLAMRRPAPFVESLTPPAPEPAPDLSAPPSEPSPEEQPMIRRPAGFKTGEIATPFIPPAPKDAPAEEESALAPLLPSSAPVAEAPPASSDAPPPPAVPPADAETPPPARPDLRTGEVDLSGLEFVRRLRRAKKDADAAADEAVEGGQEPGSIGEPAAPAPVAAVEARPLVEVEQQPSTRAFELGKIPENAALIERYLAGPRSPEVWQLDLDVFLGVSPSGGAAQTNAAERRRAFELILNADDLICARALQEEAPSQEHRTQLRSVAGAMLMLRTTLRKNADLAEGDPAEREPLLYVADHLLWERLRLEASLKRKPGVKRPPLLPKAAPAPGTGEIKAAARVRLKHRRILVRIVAVAATLTTIAGILSSSQSVAAVDPEVLKVQVAGMPGADLFDDARAFRTKLFVSAGRTWVLLGRDEKRSIVRGLGTFAAERGYDTVRVIGPLGEPWATFKDDEVLLDGDLTPSDLVKR
jgi:hypothetical protein